MTFVVAKLFIKTMKIGTNFQLSIAQINISKCEILKESSYFFFYLFIKFSKDQQVYQNKKKQTNRQTKKSKF